MMKIFILFVFIVCSAKGLNITIDDCPLGLKRDKYLKVFENSCYSFHPYRFKTFIDAQKHCQRNGGNLVMVKTPEINTFINKNLFYNYQIMYQPWIGLRYQATNDEYIWLDGTEMSYSNFADGAQYVYGSCVSLYPRDGKWFRDNCFSNNRFSEPIHDFICQYTPGLITPRPTIQQRFTTENCPPGLKRDKYLSVFEDKCYEVVTKMKTYQQSKNDCEERGGMLALVKSKAINEHIRDEFVETHYKHNADVWIGLVQEGGNFTWLDGSVMKYEHFFEPSGVYSKACFYLDVLNGAWQRTTCSLYPIPGGSNTGYSVCVYPVTNNTMFSTTKQTTTMPNARTKTNKNITTMTTITNPTTSTTRITRQPTTTPRTTRQPTTPRTTKYPTTARATRQSTTARTTKPATTKIITKSTIPTTTTACPSLVCNLDCGLSGYKYDEVTQCLLCECDF